MADAQLRILGGEALKENLFLRCLADAVWVLQARSEEHTSELQSQSNLVCRLLLEKKKKHLDKTPDKTPTTARVNAQTPSGSISHGRGSHPFDAPHMSPLHLLRCLFHMRVIILPSH